MAYLCCTKYKKYSNKKRKDMGIIPQFFKYNKKIIK